MFKGTEPKPSTGDVSTGDIEIYPILKAETLLEEERRSAWLEKLPDLLGVKPLKYKLYYVPVLHSFAEFAQNLPATKHGLYYSHRGGVLDQGIERTINVIEAINPLLKEFSEDESEEKKELWRYAVYTASLLFDVGKIFTKTIVTLRQRTKRIKIWNPFEGAMSEFASHYSYHFSTDNNDMLRRQTTPLLAMSLMPKIGFTWLSTDKDILRAWFALLQEDYRQVDAWLSTIPLIDASMLDSYFTRYEKELSKMDLSGVFKDPLQSLKSAETYKAPPQRGIFSAQGEGKFSAETKKTTFSTVAGEAFLAWLKQNVGNEKVSVNMPNSGVHVIGDGVLLLEKIFKDFVKENPIYADWREVKKQFEQLEITRQAAGDQQQAFRHYATTSDFKLLTEVTIVTNMYVVFLHHQKIPGINPHIVAVNLMQDTLPPNRPENVQGRSPSEQNIPRGT